MAAARELLAAETFDVLISDIGLQDGSGLDLMAEAKRQNPNMRGIALSGFGMQYFAAVIHYPLNIGGKPLNSWPAFIPITFEMTVLFAALAAVFGMLGLNGLPRPHHPVFNAPNFALASRNRFFLCIQARDPLFEIEAVRQVLQEHHPIAVNEVPY